MCVFTKSIQMCGLNYDSLEIEKIFKINQNHKKYTSSGVLTYQLLNISNWFKRILKYVREFFMNF